MATLRFLVKRFAAQRLLAAAVVVTLAFAIGVLVAGPVYADGAQEAIFVSAVSTSPPPVVDARFQVFGTSGFDWTTADREVRSAITALPARTVVPQGESTVRLGGVDGASTPLLFRDGAGAHLPMVAGAPPGDGEIAISSSVAGQLGLHPGDRISIVGPSGTRGRLTLSGTFRPPPPSDPFWFGSESPFPQGSSTAPLPALVTRTTFLRESPALDLSGRFVWDTYLSFAGTTFADAGRVPGELTSAVTRLQRDPALSGIRVFSGIGTLLHLVDERVGSLRVPILLVVFQIGAVALAVLAGVGSLALTRQSFELAVLHSRGFSRRTLVAAQAMQAGVAAVVAYPLGLGAGLLLATLAGHSNGPTLPGVLFPVRLSGAAEILGLAADVVGAAVLVLLSLPLVRRTVSEERRAASRESRPLLSRIPVELFLLPAGIIAFAQLRRGVKPATGVTSIDPLLLLAPTLLLFAGSFLALRVLLFALRGLDGRIGRSRRLPLYLAGRRLGRSPGVAFSAALLLLLSIGLLVVSTSYRAVALQSHEDAAHVLVGSDWRVGVAAPEQALAAIRDLPPASTAVVRTELKLDDSPFAQPPQMLAIDPATYQAGGWWRNDFSPTPLATLLSRLPTPAFGASLPPGAATLSLELGVPNAAAGMHVAATTLDPATGDVYTSSAGPLVQGIHRYDLALQGSKILSISLSAESTLDLPLHLTIDIPDATVDGAPFDLGGWEALPWRSSAGSLVRQGSGYQLRFKVGFGAVVGGLQPPAPAIPAIASPDLAGKGAFTVTIGDLNMRIDVVGSASAFPSLIPDSSFVVVPVGALLERELAVPEPGLTLNEVWATGVDPSHALRSRGFLIGDVESAGPIVERLAELPQSLAVGMDATAALAGTALVILGVAAGLYFAQRRRDYEFAALRAMGTEARQITATLVVEQAALMAFAVLAGLVLGDTMLRLMMPYFSTSIGVSYPDPILVLDRSALALAIGSILLATAAGLALSVRTLLRSSVTGVLRGEAE